MIITFLLHTFHRQVQCINERLLNIFNLFEVSEKSSLLQNNCF